MLFGLSSSVLLLVAGSTVGANPVAPFIMNEFGLLGEADSTTTVLSQSTSAALFDSGFVSTTTAKSSIRATSDTLFNAGIVSSTTAQAIVKATATHSSKPKVTSAFTSTASAASPFGTDDAPKSTTIVVPGRNGQAASTFVVPISTPSASHKTSIPLAEVSATKTAKAKATVTPTAAAAPQSSGNSTSSLAPGSQCDGTNDGAVVCSADGTLFGLCDHGSVVMMPVAKGTACRNGAIDYIADVLDIALGQIKSYLDSSETASDVFGTAQTGAVDAKDCPVALLYLKDTVDAADDTAGTDSATTNLRFKTNTDGKAVVDSTGNDVELVLKPDGTAGFQVQHECGNSDATTASKKKRQWILWVIL